MGFLDHARQPIFSCESLQLRNVRQQALEQDSRLRRAAQLQTSVIGQVLSRSKQGGLDVTTRSKPCEVHLMDVASDSMLSDAAATRSSVKALSPSPTPYQLHARTTSLERARRAEAAQNECLRGTDCSVHCIAAVTHVKNESRSGSRTK